MEHTALEAVYIFFDTATCNQIERDVKVKSQNFFRLLDSWKNIQVTTEAQLGLIGGTMGLLTGFSLLSGVEIIYYVVRFFLSLRISRANLVDAARSKFENHLMKKA